MMRNFSHMIAWYSIVRFSICTMSQNHAKLPFKIHIFSITNCMTLLQYPRAYTVIFPLGLSTNSIQCLFPSLISLIQKGLFSSLCSKICLYFSYLSTYPCAWYMLSVQDSVPLCFIEV